MPRRTIVKIYPQYDDKATFFEAPPQRMSPDRSSTDSTTTTVKSAEPEPWISGVTAFQYPVPRNGDPWEACVEKLRSYDGEMCDGWREEVDNLLIFAGLFSAAVTAFVIESYQRLSQDPMELNNWLLQQLLIETHNANTQDPAAKNATLLPLPAFAPSGTDIRVNVFWFMSLTLSLATVLIGILCTQWLREYERESPLDPKEAIPLRHLRYEGLIKWKVPKILSMLPVLLHLSLVLFFTGLIDLLWSLNLTVAIFVTIVSGVLLFFVVATTVLPTLQMLFAKNKFLHTPQCPYKSAQSWTVHRVVTFIVKLFPSGKSVWFPKFSFFDRYKPFFDDKDWVDFDIRWRDERAKAHVNNRRIDKEHAKSDMVQGLVWIDKNLGQNTEIIHSLYHCLRDLPLHHAIPTIAQLDDIVKDHLLLPTGHIKSYPTLNVPEHERHDTLSALFMELNCRAFDQLGQYQMEAIVRNINSRLEWVKRHPLSKMDAKIADSMPFVRWPIHDVRALPEDLVTQFLMCLRGLVVHRQTNDVLDQHIWELICHVISHPSIEEANAQHDIQAQLAFDIMLAYEQNLPGSDGNIEKEHDFRVLVRKCVQGIIRAFPAGELQGLSAEPRRRARMVIMAAQKRMDHIGGVELVLQTPDDRKRWTKIMTVTRGGDVALMSPGDYRSETWDNKKSTYVDPDS